MFDRNRGSPDGSASSGLCKPLTLPDNLGRESVPAEVSEQIRVKSAAV